MSVSTATVKNYVKKHFPLFGENKQREVVRLLCEIAKRENTDFRRILPLELIAASRFVALKQFLLQRRFPHLTGEERASLRHSFPELSIDSRSRVRISKRFKIQPDVLFIEKSVVESDLAKRLCQKFPKAKCAIIDSYKTFASQSPFSIQDYNQRRKNLFVVKESHHFTQACPCSPLAVPCGYQIVNLGVGCGFECSYCFLQSYINSPGIVLPANIEDFFRHLEQSCSAGRFGSGQFTDSLIFDHLTEYSLKIVNFFRSRPQYFFEFKTKSDNIGNLLKVPAAKNVLVSWSLNPQKIIEQNEFYTASLDGRMDAAGRCSQAGYSVGFHFDPIIHFPEWEDQYQNVIDKLFDRVSDNRMAYISLGCLRMTSEQKVVIENRFPQNTILDGELIPGADAKLRYPLNVRLEIYKKMLQWIRQRSKKVPVYLCMEEPAAYEHCGLKAFSYLAKDQS